MEKEFARVITRKRGRREPTIRVTTAVSVHDAQEAAENARFWIEQMAVLCIPDDQSEHAASEAIRSINAVIKYLNRK